MPIKFRCQHCRQFLGISQSKAGEIVDCPTCGRTLRVPQLDGKVIPLPKLRLDLKDSSLTQALEELAVLGQLDEEGTEGNSASFSNSSQQTVDKKGGKEEIDIPDAPPFYHGKEEGSELKPDVNEEEFPGESISIDISMPPKPAEPQMIEMPPLATPEPIVIQPKAPRKQQDESTPEPAVFASAEVHQLANENSHKEPIPWVSSLSSTASSPPLSFSKTKLIATISGFLLIGLLLGWLAGSLFYSASSADGNNHSTEKNNDMEDNNIRKNKETQPHQLAVDQFGRRAVRGRITYKTEQQSTRPDNGARVIVLPESRKGKTNIPHIGFRGGDSSTDFELAEVVLHKLGGDAAIVNEKGEYEIHLPEAGKYHIIAISHFQARDESIQVDVGLRGTLRGYFDRPEQLLGKLAFRFDEVFFDGEEVEIKDFTFDDAQ